MPQVGWKCPFSGENKTFDECIECSRGEDHCEFTTEMLILMKWGVGGPIDPERPSVTRILTACLRQSVIASIFNFYVNPRRNWYSFRGQLAHAIVEGINQRDAWKEVTQERELDIRPEGSKKPDIIRLTGRVDKIRPRAGEITDYKTTVKVPRKEPYGKHADQINAYRWLWWLVAPCNTLRLQYIDMKQTKPVYVEPMDLDEVEDMLTAKARDYVNCMRTGTIPPGEYNKENWFCRYCDVVPICKGLNKIEAKLSSKRRK